MLDNLLSQPNLLQNIMFLAPKLGISMPMIGVLVEAFNDKEIFTPGGLINGERAKIYEEKLAQLRQPTDSKAMEIGCPCCGYIMKVNLK